MLGSGGAVAEAGGGRGGFRLGGAGRCRPGGPACGGRWSRAGLVGGGEQGGYPGQRGVVAGGEGLARSVVIRRRGPAGGPGPRPGPAGRNGPAGARRRASAIPVRLARTWRRPSATAGSQGAPGSQKSAAWRRRSTSSDPGRLAVRQHVVGLVEQLEAGPGGAARVLRARRERGDQVAERLDDAEHQADRRVGQRLELGVGLLGVREEPLQHLQQDLVADVEQVRAPGGRADR